MCIPAPSLTDLDSVMPIVLFVSVSSNSSVSKVYPSSGSLSIPSLLAELSS